MLSSQKAVLPDHFEFPCMLAEFKDLPTAKQVDALPPTSCSLKSKPFKDT